MACGIQFPDQGLNSSHLPWEHSVLATGPPGMYQRWYVGTSVRMQIKSQMNKFTLSLLSPPHTGDPSTYSMGLF